MNRRRRSHGPTFWLLVAALILATTALAGTKVVVDVPAAFTGDAEIRPEGGSMKMTLARGPVNYELQVGELVIARPLLAVASGEWYAWRRDFADGSLGAGDVLTVRVEIYAPGGKGGVIRSLCLEDAWPQAYRVVQVDEPAGGKGTASAFEEILVLKFRQVVRCATP